MSVAGSSGHFPALVAASSLAGINYAQVECIQKKRLLTFVNHWIKSILPLYSTDSVAEEQNDEEEGCNTN